jgi:hypothetical protein
MAPDEQLGTADAADRPAILHDVSAASAAGLRGGCAVTGLIAAGDTRFENRFREFRNSAFRCETLRVYRGSAAGEDIRVLALESDEWPADLPTRDFHLFDSSQLFDAHYGPDGTWVGVEPVEDPARVVQACRWRDALLHAAQPWAEYIAARPDLAARLPPGAVGTPPCHQ